LRLCLLTIFSGFFAGILAQRNQVSEATRMDRAVPQTEKLTHTVPAIRQMSTDSS